MSGVSRMLCSSASIRCPGGSAQRTWALTATFEMSLTIESTPPQRYAEQAPGEPPTAHMFDLNGGALWLASPDVEAATSPTMTKQRRNYLGAVTDYSFALRGPVYRSP